MFAVFQLPERPGQNLSAGLRADPAGRAAYAREDDRHRGDSLHLQGPLLQVSVAETPPTGATLWRVCAPATAA